MIEIIDTGDGSQSLRIPELEETYHSRKGAAQESQYVFIDKGLAQINKKKVAVLEIGFGTGLNALLAWAYARKSGQTLYYTSIEKYPLKSEIYKEFSRDWLEQQSLYKEYLMLHESAWMHDVELGPEFILRKVEADWVDYKIVGTYDIVFYDAFAPSKQEEMWASKLIQRCYDSLESGGILVSYCAQGQFRRNLQDSGFIVERLEGPPGKREMIRAIKPS